MNLFWTKLRILTGWSLVAAVAAGPGAALAAQPVYPTPPGTGLLPNILYVVPYAVSTEPVVGPGPAAFPDAETEITIGVIKKCHIQVEWVDWDGTTAGVSGPPTPPPPLVPVGGAIEFHTQNVSPIPLPPYILNVSSDLPAPFEGHANIRSDCKATTKLKIDAGFVVIPSPGAVPLYKPIPTIRPDGTAAD